MGQNQQFASSRPGGRAFLFNVTNQEYFVSRTYGHFHILPTNPGAPWQVIPINDTTDRLDMGEESYYRIPILAEDVAQDIANEFAVFGVGVCKGPRPTPAEVAPVKAKMEAFFRLKLNEGDALWSKHGRHELIEDVSRRAALYFGETRPWAYEVLNKVSCPGCGEKIIATIAKHNCGAVVDIDRALAAGLITEAEAERLVKARKKLQAKVKAAPKAEEAGDFLEGSDDAEDAEEMAKQQ